MKRKMTEVEKFVASSPKNAKLFKAELKRVRKSEKISMKRKPELKPCPFCGRKAELKTGWSRVFWIQCRKCKACIGFCGSVEIATKRWNRRKLLKNQKKVKR